MWLGTREYCLNFKNIYTHLDRIGKIFFFNTYECNGLLSIPSGDAPTHLHTNGPQSQASGALTVEKPTKEKKKKTVDI